MNYILVYLPVIHAGYLQFFESHPDSEIKIIDDSIISLIDAKFDYLRKEIRSLSPQQALQSLKAVLPNRKITLINKNELEKLNNNKNSLILPNEDIFRWLVQEKLTQAHTTFSKTFLRWNRDNSQEKQKPAVTGTIQQLVLQTQRDAQNSSDWWRQVASTIFEETSKNEISKLIVTTYNKHLPHEYLPYFDSDPRNSFHKGEHIELSTAIHAEAAAIGWCAKQGISCKGKSMYVTTFPCPVCAKLIAQSGIKKLYFSDGYSMLDGEKILKSAAIEIYKV